MGTSIVVLLIAAGIAINGLSLASVVARLLRLRQPNAHREVVATLILPVTGPSPGLGQLVSAVEAQSLRPRRLIISVESVDDPAHAAASKATTRAAIPVGIVVAGQATHQAQKCRNQQAALALVDERDQAIVLMDADIRPDSAWLNALCAPLADGSADIVTGLRWQRVEQNRLGAHLVAAIDRGVMLLPRFEKPSTATVWGGSVAISRIAAARMDLSAALDTTLSDDLAIASSAAHSGLRILTRGALLVDSPTSLDLPGAWRFAVRQYRIGHIYRPGLWLLAAVAVNVRLAAWLAAIWAAISGGPFAWGLAVLAALAVVKQYLVSEVGRRLDMPDPLSIKAVQLLLGLLQPLVDAFHSCALLAAGSTRRLKWGHVTYEIRGPHDVKVRERQPFSVS
jgi:hypothetical protein